MDKPETMDVRDYLIRKVSQEQNVPLKTVKTVIDAQFREARAAVLDNNSIEIAGFGKFILSKSRVNRRLLKYKGNIARFQAELDTSEELTPAREEALNRYIKNDKKSIVYLKHKLNGFKD